MQIKKVIEYSLNKPTTDKNSIDYKHKNEILKLKNNIKILERRISRLEMENDILKGYKKAVESNSNADKLIEEIFN